MQNVFWIYLSAWAGGGGGGGGGGIITKIINMSLDTKSVFELTAIHSYSHISYLTQ